MREEIVRQIHSCFEELKTTNLELLNKDSEFLSVESYNCHLNNGHQITREKLLKGKRAGSAAIVLAMTDDKKFILAIEPRVFTKETVDIGLPAGYIEEYEQPEQAARRELLEETGYEADEIILLGSFYQDQGCSAAYNHYFLATKCKKVKEQKLDESEFVKYILVDYEELNELVDKGYIKGLNSVYTIEKVKKLIKDL